MLVRSSGLSSARHLVPQPVERDRSVPEYLQPLGAAPPEQRADPGEQLVKAERLREVVIGAAVEPAHDVLDRIARRQHQDRRVASLAPEFLRHLKPGLLREHDVEQDHVVLVDVGQHRGFRAVGGDVHDVTFLLESLLDEAGNLPVVFHQENFHGAYPPWLGSGLEIPARRHEPAWNSS